MTPFDPAHFMSMAQFGHAWRLGIDFHAQGEGWIEVRLPYGPDAVGDADTGALAAGPIVTLLDMATTLAIWVRRGFAPQVTLELRFDHLWPTTPGEALIGRGECYQISGSVAFVSGVAYHADLRDPVAHVAGTFMLTGAA